MFLFSGEVKDIRKVPFYFLLHMLHKPVLPPCTPPPHPFRARTQNPPLRPHLRKVGKLIRRRRRRISLKRVKHPSAHGQKHFKVLNFLKPPAL
jgi:hypothetical protein